MSKAPTTAPTQPRDSKARPRRNRGQFVPLLAAGLALVFATPTVALLGLLLLPSVMATIVDRTQGRPATLAVALFGLASACDKLDLLWRSGHRMEDAMAIGLDLATLALCWAAQAAAWLLTQILPIIIGFALEAKAHLHIAQLDRRRTQLLAEWTTPPG